MKPIHVVVILIALGLFMGAVINTTLQRAAVHCEVCLEFSGQEVCRSGSGPSREEAQQAAQESVCGGNVSGMAEIIACRNAQPTRVQCSAED